MRVRPRNGGKSRESPDDSAWINETTGPVSFKEAAKPEGYVSLLQGSKVGRSAMSFPACLVSRCESLSRMVPSSPALLLPADRVSDSRLQELLCWWVSTSHNPSGKDKVDPECKNKRFSSGSI